MQTRSQRDNLLNLILQNYCYMSVYTTVSRRELELFLHNYQVGTLDTYQGIEAGIENTNYFVNTCNQSAKTQFVLTLFEKHSFAEMPFFLNLMAHLKKQQIPSAAPIASSCGKLLLELNKKPAALVERLAGSDVAAPNNKQIAAIASAMAKMHMATLNYRPQRANCRDLDWQQAAFLKLKNKLSAKDGKLIDQELEFQSQVLRHKLPQGAIHADLFCDNALFVGDKLSGIIDFYFACTDAFLYDVAVAINDWCKSETKPHQAKMDKVAVFLQAYAKHRALTTLEKQYFSAMLRAAALRFWLSRLIDFHFPRQGEITHTKDPNHFKLVLTHRIENADKYSELLTNGEN